MQKPHCMAWFSWKACCIGVSSPPGGQVLDGPDRAPVNLDCQGTNPIRIVTTDYPSHISLYVEHLKWLPAAMSAS